MSIGVILIRASIGSICMTVVMATLVVMGCHSGAFDFSIFLLFKSMSSTGVGTVLTCMGASVNRVTRAMASTMSVSSDSVSSDSVADDSVA